MKYLSNWIKYLVWRYQVIKSTQNFETWVFFSNHILNKNFSIHYQGFWSSSHSNRINMVENLIRNSGGIDSIASLFLPRLSALLRPSSSFEKKADMWRLQTRLWRRPRSLWPRETFSFLHFYFSLLYFSSSSSSSSPSSLLSFWH